MKLAGRPSLHWLSSTFTAKTSRLTLLMACAELLAVCEPVLVDVQIHTVQYILL